ncbi:response regulator transcription factor [Sphingomonas sp. PAMC 26617]|uniref:response regulator transcription factor n=1 Tax=Sphingomonas sp. PAMC 26617 TaxID=1112216 RepID=UPI000288B056|nr:response regulator [Sphingomonas sp. PAMC 26617]
MPHNPHIALVEDDGDVSQSLVRLLTAADFTVSAYPSASDFLDHPYAVHSDCIVSDVRMPDITGVDLLMLLRDRGVDIPVILITGHGDVPLAVQAMKLGARDFLEKPFDPQTLLDAIARALAGGDGSGNAAMEAHARAEARELVARLSPRERQVLQGIVAGHLNKQIAHDLHLSVRTVEVYRASIMTKINVHGTSNLVRVGLLAGLQEGPPPESKPQAIPNVPDKGALEPRPY